MLSIKKRIRVHLFISFFIFCALILLTYFNVSNLLLNGILLIIFIVNSGLIIHVLQQRIFTPMEWLSQPPEQIVNCAYPKHYVLSAFVQYVHQQSKSITDAITLVDAIQNQQSECPTVKTPSDLTVRLTTLFEKIAQLNTDNKNRHWVNQSILNFNTHLTNTNKSKKDIELIQEGLQRIVKQTKGCQALIHQYHKKDQQLEEIASYGISQSQDPIITRKDDGLLGQMISSPTPQYMTNLPADFPKIESGLGSSVPTSLLLHPMILHDELYGVLEITFLHVLSEYEKEYLDKTAQILAIYLQNHLTQKRSEEMFEEASQVNIQLQTKEEQMVQQNEALQATQVELSEKLHVIEQETKKNQSILSALDKTLVSVEFNASGEIKESNHLFCSVMGYLHVELLDKNIQDLIPQNERERHILQLMWANLLEGKYFTGEFKYADKKGRIVWLNGTYHPILNDAGKVQKILCFANFITDIKESNQDLVSTLNALKNIIPILEVHPDGQPKTANKIFLNLVQLTRSKLKQKKLNELFFINEKPVTQSLETLCEAKEVISIAQENNTHVFYILHTAPIINLEGKVVKYILILRKIQNQSLLTS